jgi:hypothetical protein
MLRYTFLLAVSLGESPPTAIAAILVSFILALTDAALSSGCRWSAASPGQAMNGHNDGARGGVSLAQCQALCEDETNYKCVAIEYIPKTNYCYLSKTPR